MSIFKYLHHFFGEDFIIEFLIYLKNWLVFKGLLILDLSYFKIKDKTKINPERVKEILVNRLSFVFLDKLGGNGRE